jgi:FtsH-binding integral membrane protein
MTSAEIETVLRLHEDTTNLIAAGKVARWEVVKWVVTANVALATASAAANFDSTSRFWIFVFAALLAFFGGVLLSHYNSRMAQARERLGHLNKYIRERVFDINALGGPEWDRTKDERYDWQELWIFGSAITLSVIPPLVSVFLVK